MSVLRDYYHWSNDRVPRPRHWRRIPNVCDTLAASYQRAGVESESSHPDDIGVPIRLQLVRFAETAAGAEPD